MTQKNTRQLAARDLIGMREPIAVRPVGGPLAYFDLAGATSSGQEVSVAIGKRYPRGISTHAGGVYIVAPHRMFDIREIEEGARR